MRLPAQHTFPGGYRVEIRCVSPRKIKAIAREPVFGLWVGGSSGGTIYLDDSLPLDGIWDIFTHEFTHAANDWEHWVRMNVSGPVLQGRVDEAIKIVQEDD